MLLRDQFSSLSNQNIAEYFGINSGNDKINSTDNVPKLQSKPVWLENTHIYTDYNPCLYIKSFLDNINNDDKIYSINKINVCYEEKNGVFSVEYAYTQTDIIIIKIYVYKDNESYILEVQKRSGDSFCFWNFYNELISYVKTNGLETGEPKTLLLDIPNTSTTTNVDSLIENVTNMLMSDYVESFTSAVQIYTICLINYATLETYKELLNNTLPIEILASKIIYTTIEIKYTLISLIINAWLNVHLKNCIIKYNLHKKIYDSLKTDSSLLIRTYVKKLEILCGETLCETLCDEIIEEIQV